MGKLGEPCAFQVDILFEHITVLICLGNKIPVLGIDKESGLSIGNLLYPLALAVVEILARWDAVLNGLNKPVVLVVYQCLGSCGCDISVCIICEGNRMDPSNR